MTNQDILYALLQQMRIKHPKWGNVVLLHQEDRKELRKLMGLSEPNFNATLGALVKKGIIAKISSGLYRFLKF